MNLSDREILIAGAIAYWCEGAKTKPSRHIDRVIFINSDAALIRFFLRFLSAAGVRPEDLVLRVYIHETADVEAAQRYWLAVTGTRPDQFRRPALKRHVPKTVRTNVGGHYLGCLRVEVRQRGTLYRQIEGWASAAMYRGLTRPAGIHRTSPLLPGKDSNPRLSGPKPLVLPELDDPGSQHRTLQVSQPSRLRNRDAAGNSHTPHTTGQWYARERLDSTGAGGLGGC